jgi:hypothetical protein
VLLSTPDRQVAGLIKEDMKKKFSILLAAVVLSACSPKELVLQADIGQRGAGATIALKDGKGTLVAPVLQRWPDGLRSAALLTDDYNQLNQRFLTVEAEPKMKLMLISVPGNTKAFACDTCSDFGLPHDWTLKSR